jgi:hypothetical protein
MGGSAAGGGPGLTATRRARLLLLGPRDGLDRSARFGPDPCISTGLDSAGRPFRNLGQHRRRQPSPAYHVDVMSHCHVKGKGGNGRSGRWATPRLPRERLLQSREDAHPRPLAFILQARLRLPSFPFHPLSLSPPSPPAGEGERDGEKRWDRTRRPRNGPSRSSARPTSNGSPSLTTVRSATPLSNSPRILQMVGAEFFPL